MTSEPVSLEINPQVLKPNLQLTAVKDTKFGINTWKFEAKIEEGSYPIAEWSVAFGDENQQLTKVEENIREKIKEL